MFRFQKFFAMVVAAFFFAAPVVTTTTPSEAGQKATCTQSQSDCDREHTPAKGRAPRYAVSFCFLGGVGSPGNRTRVDCGSARALHSIDGRRVVCFVATDGHEYHDLQTVVWKGHRFFNHRINGRWQPDWE